MLLSVAAPCDFGWTQGVSISPDGVKLTGFGQVDVDKTVQHWSDRTRTAITGEMNLQVELIADVCELNTPETTKLRNLVSVVANRRLLNGRKQLKEFIYDSQLAERGPDTSPAKEEFGDKLIPFKAGRGERGVVEIAARFDRPLNEQPLWKKVLKSSLSTKQWEAYESHCKERNQMFVVAAITRAIAELDSDVFLTTDQSNHIRQMAIESLQTDITIERPSSFSQAESLTQPWFRNQENLQLFLRESQLLRIKEIKQVKKMRGVSWSR